MVVRDWTPPDPDVVTALAREETAAGLPGYRRVRIDLASQGGVWEYTFTDPKRGPLHGMDRAVVEGGRSYVIQWRTPAAAWDQHLAELASVTTTFRPAVPCPASDPNVLPAGYGWFKSPSGFKVAAPTAYQMISKNKVRAFYCAPTGLPLFGVRTWIRSSTTDLGAALRREESLAKLADYRRISMEVLPGQQGAVWEYTFTDPRWGTLRSVERAFIAPSGKAYLLHWRTAPGIGPGTSGSSGSSPPASVPNGCRERSNGRRLAPGEGAGQFRPVSAGRAYGTRCPDGARRSSG